MKCLFLLIVALCAGCGDSARRAVAMRVPAEHRADAAALVVSICEASNPRSDEEPEDMIQEAWRVTLDLYGVPVDSVQHLYASNNRATVPINGAPDWLLDLLPEDEDVDDDDQEEGESGEE